MPTGRKEISMEEENCMALDKEALFALYRALIELTTWWEIICPTRFAEREALRHYIKLVQRSL
jgi:hypothetical protein